MSSLCTNVPVNSMHIRDQSHAEWDHYTANTVQSVQYVKMALSPMCVCVCVGNERVESQCSVLPRPAEVTVALNMIQKSLIVKYSNTSSTHVYLYTMEHHSKAIH